MAYPDLSNYKGRYATIQDAISAGQNGTFTRAQPTPVSTPVSTSAPVGMAPVQTFHPSGPVVQQPLVPQVKPMVPQVKPVQPPPIDVNGITQRITADYNNQLGAQKQAIQQELAKVQQGNALGITQNNNQLQDELQKLNENKQMNDQAAQELQNRRGGFYSGGLDYQLGNIARSNTQAIGQATRDIAARNADLWSKDALAAAQAAQNIQMLQSQAPDKIRSLIQQEIDRQRGISMQEASLTGQYNGAPTMAAQQQAFNQMNADRNYNLNLGQMTGVIEDPQVAAAKRQMQQNSIAWFNASPEEQSRLAQENQQLGAAIGATQDANGDWVFPQAGTPTLQAQNQAFNQNLQQQQFEYKKLRDQIGDEQYKQKFDEDVRRFGLQYAADQAYRNGQLAISQQNANTSAFNAQRQAQNDSLNALYKQWEATGKAPEGIPGVKPGTSLFDQVGARQENQPKSSKIDNKTSVDNATFFKSQIQGKKGITKEQALQYIQSNAGQLNDQDYKSLINWVQDNVGLQ